MNELLQTVDWANVVSVIWSIVLLPMITYIGSQLADFAKANKLDKYTDILYQNVSDAVKDIYETIVKDIKHDPGVWTAQKQEEVKELAKTKAVHALSSSALQLLKAANTDFDAYLDSLIGSVLYDLKNQT